VLGAVVAPTDPIAASSIAAALLFSKFRVNPLMALVPVGAAFFFFGYGLQRLVLRPFVIRPQHSQFLLLLALAVVITSILLIMSGPMPASLTSIACSNRLS